MGRTVAVKTLHPNLVEAKSDRERFFREARAAAQLRHPGIVMVHEVAEIDGLPAIVSDFVEGVTVRELLEVRRLSVREAAEVTAQVADALDYAHSLKVVHRDIKPANIMIELDGASLNTPLDRTHAGSIAASASMTTPVSSQAGYSSLRSGPRARLLDFGLALRDEPQSPRKVNRTIPRDLDTIYEKAMAKSPGARYATARALSDDLRRWLNGLPIQARRVSETERFVRWCRRNPVLATLPTCWRMQEGRQVVQRKSDDKSSHSNRLLGRQPGHDTDPPSRRAGFVRNSITPPANPSVSVVVSDMAVTLVNGLDRVYDLRERPDGSFEMFAQTPSGRRIWVIWRYDRDEDEGFDAISEPDELPLFVITAN